MTDNSFRFSGSFFSPPPPSDPSYVHAYERFERAAQLRMPFDRDRALQAGWLFAQSNRDYQKEVRQIRILGEHQATYGLWHLLHEPWPSSVTISTRLTGDDSLMHSMLFPGDSYRSRGLQLPVLSWAFPNGSRGRHLDTLHRHRSSLSTQALGMALSTGNRAHLDWDSPRWNIPPATIWRSSNTNVLTPGSYRQWLPMLDLLEAGVWCIILAANVLFLVPIPRTLKTDDNNLLHSATGPAIEWLDMSTYHWHGVAVQERIITAPETITVEQIQSTGNVELRRVLMERMGYDRYIQESGAVSRASDAFGTIWHSTIQGDEDMYVIEVVNSTPEPDGHHKHYWLRFDPSAYNRHAMEHPQAAIASTWRNRDNSMLFRDWRTYRPVLET